MNKVILVGNLTRDPESSQTSSGVSVCKFSMAVNRNYTNANGERDTDYINILTWRGLADNCAKYCTKGMKVGICGQIQTRSYDDKDGNKRYITEVIADEVEFISYPKTECAEPKQAPKIGSKKSVQDLKPIEDDGLPF